MLGRTDALTVVGPAGLRPMFDALPGLANLTFEVVHVSLDDGFEHAVVYEDAHVTVEARPIEHRVFCAGYRYTEKTRPGHLDGAAARAAGLTDGDQFEAIKRGETVGLTDGTRVGPEGLLGPDRPGASFAYVLDTMPCAGGVALARGADLLMHEATFGEAFAARAVEVGHSTAREAAGVAREADAKRLLLTHFSARYGDVSGLVDEARAIFPATEAAEELAVYTVGATRSASAPTARV